MVATESSSIHDLPNAGRVVKARQRPLAKYSGNVAGLVPCFATDLEQIDQFSLNIAAADPYTRPRVNR